MKEIKFRAWDKKQRKWLLGYEYPNLGGFSLFGEVVLMGEWQGVLNAYIFNRDGRSFEDLSVMQYTGLKDDNDKEIYEDDLLRVQAPEWDWVGVVKFGNPNGLYNWGFQLKPVSLKEDEVNPEILLWVETEVPGHTCEIIGNLYENPELLSNKGLTL